MFNWLRGPGEAFRHPLPGSTNYLSAYSPNGELFRAMDQVKQQDLEKKDKEEGAEESEGLDQVDESNLPSEQRSDPNVAGEKPLPKERAGDLRPFPLNENFQSQRVLSEELRQEIWSRVKLKGDSVRAVSAALGVEMRRVAAVVRLVELEHEMARQV